MPAAVAHDWPMHRFAVALDCDAKPGGEDCQLQHAPVRDSPQRAQHERLAREHATGCSTVGVHTSPRSLQVFLLARLLFLGEASACHSLSCCNLVLSQSSDAVTCTAMPQLYRAIR